jgi:hypothetical protein
MKSTLIIKDLALDKELDCKAMSAVHGGHNLSSINNKSEQNAFSWGAASPITQVNVVSNVVNQIDLDSFDSKKLYPVRF